MSVIRTFCEEQLNRPVLESADCSIDGGLTDDYDIK